ncbi:SDR family NAD(P)-dependent oxidoreductase [Paraconexibacter sp.]|uniref:SDR family NAD(P)-dependent oxidoreductase n=1 Tax=Paraconexibacter sp. TaxID=2949640 RepID=UPI00356901DF
MDLTGTTCLVTGAGRGIGLGIARALAERPVDLLLIGMRDPSGGPPLHPGDPGVRAREIRAVRMDLGSQEAIDACCDALAAELGALDLLVNNAGQVTGGLLEEQDLGEIYAMFQANLVGLVHLTHRVLPAMLARGHGKVVNNASISGYAAVPAASTYAASKHGVVGFSESLRRELVGTGVSVMHLVTPGVATDMLATTDDLYGRHMDTSDWPRQTPEAWGAKVVEAIERDAVRLMPRDRSRILVALSRGPAKLVDAVAARMFTRSPGA